MANCTILPNKKEHLLSQTFVPGKDYELKILFSPSDATIQSAIVVKAVFTDKKEKQITYFEGYNYLDTFYFKNDTSLILVISDTISYLGNKPDTVTVGVTSIKP